MNKNLEIELKTLITNDEYDRLITLYNLENNIYTQVNHYFDTEDFYFQKQEIVLRIRQKKNSFKLTSKCHSKKGAFETHLILSKEEASQILSNGFDSSLINLEGFVYKRSELTTHRCKMPYKDGIIFLDKSEYYGNVDYEIEYEADTLEQCEQNFNKFLDENKIKLIKPPTKSFRAFNCKKE